MDTLTMFGLFFILPNFAFGDNFVVLHSPDSLFFNKTGEDVTYDLRNKIYSASLGHQINEAIEWDGLFIRNPVTVPSTILEITIYGESNFVCDNFPFEVTYPIKSFNDEDKYAELEFHHLNNEISDSSFEDTNLDQFSPHFLGNGDKKVNTFSASLSKNDDGAKQNLCNRIKEIVDSLKNKRVLVTAILTEEDVGKRVRRQANDPAADPAATPAPVAPNNMPSDAYSADYAAIFNIILWFSLVFAFSLVAIVYALMDMDPGRDSIIYRMTSTRMKKDN